MDRTPQKRKRLSASERVDSTTKPSNPIDSASRRQFLTKVGMATVAAGVLGKAPSALASAGTALVSGPSTSSSKSRVQQALTLRVNNAGLPARTCYRRLSRRDRQLTRRTRRVMEPLREPASQS